MIQAIRTTVFLAFLALAGCGGGGGSTPPTLAELNAFWSPPSDAISADVVTGEVAGAFIAADGFMELSETLPEDPEDPEAIRSRQYFGYIELVDGDFNGLLNYVELGGPFGESVTGIVSVSGVAVDAQNISGLIEFPDASTLSFVLERGDEVEPTVIDERITGEWATSPFSFPSPEFDLTLNFDAAGNGVGTVQEVCLLAASLTPLYTAETSSENNPLLTVQRINLEATGGCADEGSYVGTAVVLELPFGNPPVEVLGLRIGNAETTFEIGLNRPFSPAAL